MSNLVEIKYGNNSRFPVVSINGEAISRYMSLSDYIYDDIFKWADHFYDIVDSELAEEYNVVITGHPYHAIVLNSLLGKSEFCKNISFENDVHKISVSDKYNYINKLQARVGKATEDNNSIMFSCVSCENFEALELSNLNLTTKASEYGLAMNENEAEQLNCKYCVILSDYDGVNKNKNRTILYITKENLPILVDYFLNYHIYLAKLEEYYANFNSAAYSDETKAEFEAYYYEELRVHLPQEFPETMTVGDSVNVIYKVFPECMPNSGISLKSSNTSVIEYTDGKLRALNPGTSVISISDSNGKEYASKTVTVCKYSYATNITIILPTTTMNIGDTLQFRTIITPTDAEDINDITYSVNNESVAVISGPNELYAVSDGRVCVTVSTPRISKKFYITVLPKPYDIAVSSEEIKLPINADATIFGAVVPRNVMPMPALNWFVSNNNVVNIVYCDSTRCIVESVNYGTAVLTCRIADSDIYKRITITVPKKLGCYVATSVYGSYDCSEVWVLRRFRDNYLSKNVFGRLFIKLYYSISPTIVRIFGKQKWFNRFWKVPLDNIVKNLKEKGYEDTPYMDN